MEKFQAATWYSSAGSRPIRPSLDGCLGSSPAAAGTHAGRATRSPRSRHAGLRNAQGGVPATGCTQADSNSPATLPLFFGFDDTTLALT